jgi:hypothetical protein
VARYNVRIKTKNETYAGTDSTVAIYFSGPNGGSGVPGNGWVKLDNYGNDFEPGDNDIYEVEGNVNGPITTIRLALDGNDEWRPESVIIEDVSARLFWQADFDGERLENKIAERSARLITTPPVPSESTMERERRLAQAWLKNYSAGIAAACKGAVSSIDLLVPILLVALEKAGFNARFVTVGGGFNVGAGYTAAIDAGGVFQVRNMRLGTKVANYMTLSRGWDISAGGSAGAVVAAWSVADLKGLNGTAESFHLSAQAGIGLAVSAIFSSGNAPTGVQIAVLAGPDVAVGGGQMTPYTWTWPV